LTALQVQAAVILHSVPADVTYEDIVQALKDRYGDYQLAAVYQSQLKARFHTSGETLQDFPATIKQLADPFVGLNVE
jgi:lipid A disaccharide synthetase